jgi:hypothetical protein
MNTFVVPTWVKRETVAVVADRVGLPRAIVEQATDAQIEQMADDLARAFAETADDESEDA